LLRSANTAEMAIALLAVIKIGAIAVPSMPQLKARELAVMLEKAQVNCILCSTNLLQEMRLAMLAANSNALLARLDDEFDVGVPSICRLAKTKSGPCPAFPSQQDDICLLGFTSGTTGKPKATIHFQRDLLAICDHFPQSHLQLASSDVCIGTPSLAFTFGLGALLLFPLRYGAASILQSYANAEQFWQVASQEQASVCFSAPTFYRKLALQPILPHHCLRLTVSAGEALPISTRQLWQEATGIEMIDGLGATEMLHIFIANLPGQSRVGAIGKAIPGYQVAILNEAGLPCAPGVAGRLAVQGLSLIHI
jgi:2-aminobenzoate-CoA ligase